MADENNAKIIPFPQQSIEYTLSVGSDSIPDLEAIQDALGLEGLDPEDVSEIFTRSAEAILGLARQGFVIANDDGSREILLRRKDDATNYRYRIAEPAAE